MGYELLATNEHIVRVFYVAPVILWISKISRLSTREDRSHRYYLSAGAGVKIKKEEDSDPDDDALLVKLDKLRKSKRPKFYDFVSPVIDVKEDISSEDSSGDDYRPEQVEYDSSEESSDDEPLRKKKAGGRVVENSREAKIKPDMFDRRKIEVVKEDKNGFQLVVRNQKKDGSKGRSNGAVSEESMAVEVSRAVQQTGVTAFLPP